MQMLAIPRLIHNLRATMIVLRSEKLALTYDLISTRLLTPPLQRTRHPVCRQSFLDFPSLVQLAHAEWWRGSCIRDLYRTNES